MYIHMGRTFVLYIYFVVVLFINLEQTWCAPLDKNERQSDKPFFEIENDSYHRLAFLPTGRYLVLGGGRISPGNLSVLNIETKKTLFTRKDHIFAIWAVAVSPDGTKIATGGGFGEVKVYESKTGKVLANMDGGGEYTYTIAFSPDGKFLASAAGLKVNLWEVANLKTPIKTIDVKSQPRVLTFSPNSKLLAIADDSLRLWSITKEEDSIQAPYRRAYGLTWLPDGKTLLVSGTEDNPSLIYLWSFEERKEMHVFKGHQLGKAVTNIVVDPDGKYLVSGGGDRSVRLWDLAAGKMMTCVTADKGFVRSISFSYDSKYLAVCSDDAIRVWEFQKLLEFATRSAEQKAHP